MVQHCKDTSVTGRTGAGTQSPENKFFNSESKETKWKKTNSRLETDNSPKSKTYKQVRYWRQTNKEHERTKTIWHRHEAGAEFKYTKEQDTGETHLCLVIRVM